MIDRRGLFTFLGLTFGITYLVEGILLLSGFRADRLPPLYGQLIIVGAMWVPALSTWITIKFVTREGFAITNLRLGPLRPYLKTAWLIPAVFVVVYALSWLLGLGHPDWGLVRLQEMLASGGADTAGMPPPALLLPLLFVGSLILTPFINSIFGFGEEFGWRGYLLPKLMPLGKFKAYLLIGVIWGLWHAPLILAGFNYPGFPVPGIIAMVGVTTALGIFINEMSLRNRSSILAGWIHGVFNCQAYGVWRVLFPDVNPLLGGFTGLLGIAAWLVVGIRTVRKSPRL